MQKKTVVLYNPKAVFYTMPLALLAIGSYLDPLKYNVVIIDGRLEKDPLPKIFSALKDNAVCFAVTVLTGRPIKDALHVSRTVKQKFPDLPIVWGGWHPSLFLFETLLEDSVDIVVKGQGEISFAEVIQKLINKEQLAGVNGIGYKVDNKIIINPERHLADINSFLPLNYNLIDVAAYMQLSGRKQLDYISSQGCRFRCAFCADPAMYKRRWHGYLPQRIGEEIDELWQQHHFEHVHFQDETFFTNRDRVKGVAEEFIKRKLPISWFGTMRADQGVRLPFEIWSLCKKSGLERVMIGMESGTQQMLDWMQKDIRLEHIFETAEQCIKHDIAINFSVIVGFPNEPKESVSETLEVVKRLRRMSSDFVVNIFYYKPYPGNKIADELAIQNYRFPKGLEEWSDFDYVDSGKSDWLTDEQVQHIEAFKFYQQLAWSKPVVSKYVLQQIAKLRCNKNIYAFPLEKKIVRFIKPVKQMS
ncbi:B12-binding domain-containing radical SAM protein [Chitinophagaceae bacterium LB-8]|uniref:B12-binding domain-containing radical SAM protein n=1 Tax=Paraflavisolibacter caeni TaxID=2982496 RepID=A0A9X2Y1H7_9BACT|nr:radical SAM protein [Paraflavisolibacter caeni]MCU7552882.1 B12-binding domain-containing radical SAM protein [Paraflavisolibacter caeni]